MAQFFEDIYEWFLMEPVRLYNLGWTLLYVGWGLVVFGLIAKVAIASLTVATLSGAIKVPQTLGELVPSWPTWWVPEQPLGYLLPVVVVALGASATISAKRYMRLMRSL